MSTLRNTFSACASAGRSAFIPYITAGDPSLQDTATFVRTLAAAGADILELGVPFSDPIADGPVNQQAAERALAAGTTLQGILNLVRDLRAEGMTLPIILFTYLNPVLRMGLDSFAAQAVAAGVTGLLVVDLPPEAAGPYGAVMALHGLETVFLVSPTSPPERLKAAAQASTGFVYVVSRTGVTGEQISLADSLPQEIARLRTYIDAPLAVGFGISTPEQAHTVAQLADGVVVGSALVRTIAAGPDLATTQKNLEEQARALQSATQKG